MHAPVMSAPTVSPLNALLRGFLGFVLGMILGGCANMGIIIGGGMLLPPPAGVDVQNIETIKAHIGEYSVLQLMVPLSAHAAGSLVGAFIAARIAATPRSKKALALVIGLAFLLGGAMAVSMIPAPLWFNTVDLALAYLPMAWLGYRLATGCKCCSRA